MKPEWWTRPIAIVGARSGLYSFLCSPEIGTAGLSTYYAQYQIKYKFEIDFFLIFAYARNANFVYTDCNH